jgi:hypothetical protein
LAGKLAVMIGPLSHGLISLSPRWETSDGHAFHHGFLVVKLVLLANVDKQCCKAAVSVEEPLPAAWQTEKQNSLFFLFTPA